MQVMPGGAFLADADRAALRVVQVIVFDDPALAPVRAQHSGLVCGRRRPGAGGLRDLKPAHRDKVDVRLIRIEAAFAHVDFHGFRVGIRAVEVGVYRSGLEVHFGEPLVDRLLGVQDVLGVQAPRRNEAGEAFLRMEHRFAGFCFVEGHTVEINVARMHGSVQRIYHPVAADRFRVGL